MHCVILTPRQAEFLSWLQGLGPVGEIQIFDRQAARADLGFGHLSALTHMVRQLRDKGVIRYFGANNYEVLLRLEDPRVTVRRQRGGYVRDGHIRKLRRPLPYAGHEGAGAMAVPS